MRNTFEKILFLDIDGVLATNKCYDMPRHNTRSEEYPGPYFYDKKCVEVLNKITDLFPDIVLILHSDWRFYYTLEEMNKIFKYNGIKKELYSLVPNIYKLSMNSYETRVYAIKTFLEENIVKKYLVLDDIDLSGAFKDNFIYCKDTELGISKPGLFEKIAKKFRK